MKIREIQDEILQLKKEQDFCVLAHSYQATEITEIADFTGDSYALSVKAAKVPQKNILMCGVRWRKPLRFCHRKSRSFSPAPMPAALWQSR